MWYGITMYFAVIPQSADLDFFFFFFFWRWVWIQREVCRRLSNTWCIKWHCVLISTMSFTAWEIRSKESQIRFKWCVWYQKHFHPLQMADALDMVSGFHIESNDTKGYNIWEYLLCARNHLRNLTQNRLKSSWQSVVFILLIYKIKQKRRLSKFAKLIQGHTDRK